MFSYLGSKIVLLGIGEVLHGGEEILLFRNQLFQYLVNNYGFSAIALESSLTRGRLVNDYVSGKDPDIIETVFTKGFSQGFGDLEANHELVAWMRKYNADSSGKKIRFYGFDSPTEMTHTDSPSELLTLVTDYLSSIDSHSGDKYRHHIELLLGNDQDWENTEAMINPEFSIGRSVSAVALRILIEELICELNVRCPELIAFSDRDRYQEAMHYASDARQLLNYHANLADDTSDRLTKGLSIRDAMMADNLSFIVQNEITRGKVLAFGHKSHLKKTKAQWHPGSGKNYR